jgi:hypothetical protein
MEGIIWKYEMIGLASGFGGTSIYGGILRGDDHSFSIE